MYLDTFYAVYEKQLTRGISFEDFKGFALQKDLMPFFEKKERIKKNEDK